MAFASEAHKRKCQELVRDGKMLKSTYDKHEKETGSMKLPERIDEPTKSLKIGRVKTIK